MVTLDRGELAITVWGKMCKNKKQKKHRAHCIQDGAAAVGVVMLKFL